MASVVRSVSLFPETRFWKMGKKSEMNHVFGGFASLLLIAAITAIFIYKLVEVFNRTTLTVTTQNNYNNTLSTLVTTTQSSSIVKPTMLAFNIQSANLQLRAYPSVGTSDITMETCTSKHFTAFSQSISYEMFPDNSCLPINTSYTIDSTLNNLIFEISCKNGFYCDASDRFIISIVSAQPNLYEKQKDPWVSSFQQFFYNYENLNVRVNIDLKQDQMVTDSSLFPFETKVNKVTGLTATIQPRDQKIVSASGSHTIILRGKNYYNLHNRSFLKVLDALSYIGGIFNSLIAAFFFMKMYGESSFEMDFAVRYFRKKQARNFGFMSFLKQAIYAGLKSAGCKPDWQISEKRQQLRDTVGNMMDVIYLQRRIEYLQRAITVILEPHHRKGLQLVKPKREETDQCCTKYSFRDRLIAFFKERERRPPLLQQEPKDLDQHIGKVQSSSSLKEDKQVEELPRNQALNKQSPNGSQKEIKPEIQTGFKKFMTIPHEDEEDIFLFQALAEESQGTTPEEIEAEVANDLTRLIQEAQSSSDPRSKQIVDLIDNRIREWLKETVEKNKNNYLFKFNLAE